MRRRGALLSPGVAAMAAVDPSPPSARVADRTYAVLCASRSRRADAGQQYQREVGRSENLSMPTIFPFL